MDLMIGIGTKWFSDTTRHKLSESKILSERSLDDLRMVGVLGILGESIGHLSIDYSGAGEGWQIWLLIWPNQNLKT